MHDNLSIELEGSICAKKVVTFADAYTLFFRTAYVENIYGHKCFFRSTSIRIQVFHENSIGMAQNHF